MHSVAVAYRTSISPRTPAATISPRLTTAISTTTRTCSSTLRVLVAPTSERARRSSSIPNCPPRDRTRRTSSATKALTGNATVALLKFSISDMFLERCEIQRLKSVRELRYIHHRNPEPTQRTFPRIDSATSFELSSMSVAFEYPVRPEASRDSVDTGREPPLSIPTALRTRVNVPQQEASRSECRDSGLTRYTYDCTLNCNNGLYTSRREH